MESHHLISSMLPNKLILRRSSTSNTFNNTSTKKMRLECRRPLQTSQFQTCQKRRSCKWIRLLKIRRTTKDTGMKRRTGSSLSWSMNTGPRTGRRLHSTSLTELTCNACTGGRRFSIRWWSRVLGAVRKTASLLKTSRSLEQRTGATLPKLFPEELESSVVSDGTITWIQLSRKTNGVRKRTGPSLKHTKNTATSGLKSPSLSLEGLTIT